MTRKTQKGNDSTTLHGTSGSVRSSPEYQGLVGGIAEVLDSARRTLILCTHKDEALALYTLDNLPNKVLAAEYKTAFPDEKLIAEELERTRRMLEARQPRKTPKNKKREMK